MKWRLTGKRRDAPKDNLWGFPSSGVYLNCAVGYAHSGHPFEVLGMDTGDGHVFAAAIMTLGGPHAAQDSFGLQYAVLCWARREYS